MEHWSEIKAKKYNLPKRCDELLGRANDGNSKHMEDCLVEALSPENLQISMLKNERERVIRELRLILMENGSPQAIKIFESVLESMNTTPRSVPGYRLMSKDL